MAPETPATAAPNPRAVGAHDCPRCGEPYSLDGCGCPTTTAALEAVLALHRPYILTSRTQACRLADSMDDDHEDDESCFEEVTSATGAASSSRDAAPEPRSRRARVPDTAARRCLNCDLPVTRSRLFCGRCDRTLGVREREALYPKEKR